MAPGSHVYVNFSARLGSYTICCVRYECLDLDWGFQTPAGDSSHPRVVDAVSSLFHWTMGEALLDPVLNLKQPLVGPPSFSLSRAWSHWSLPLSWMLQKSVPQLLGLIFRSKNHGPFCFSSYSSQWLWVFSLFLSPILVSSSITYPTFFFFG